MLKGGGGDLNAAELRLVIFSGCNFARVMGVDFRWGLPAPILNSLLLHYRVWLHDFASNDAQMQQNISVLFRSFSSHGHTEERGIF